MKFCMVTSFYPPYNMGGDGIFLYQLCNELAERGHDVHVVHCIDAYFAKRKQRNPGSWDQGGRVTVHRLKSRAGWLSPLASMVTGRPILKYRRLRDIFSQPYDVIHYHTVSLIGGPAIFAMGRGIKLKTLHTYWMVCPTSFLFKNDREICVKKQCWSCSTIVAKRPPQLWRYTALLEQSLDHMDAMIAPSRFSQRLHQEAFAGRRVEYLPHFVSLGDWRDESASIRPAAYLQNGRRYFLYVGRLVYNKGVQELIDAFKGQQDRQLVIVGDGPYRETLTARAAGDPRIHFLGEQGRASLAALYRMAAALVVPSIWHEVVGIVALEAMSHGVPVIVRDVGGLGELVTENQTGFAYRSVDELRGLLRSFDEDRDDVRRCAENGPRAVRERYSPQVHVDQYLTLIQSLKRSRSDT